MKKIKSSFLIVLCFYGMIESCQNAPSPKIEQVEANQIDSLPSAPAAIPIRLEENHWHVFRGEKGGNRIQVTFYVSDNQSIEGHFVDEKDYLKIPITGTIKGITLTFEAFNGSQRFNGTLDEKDKFTGSWSDAVTSETIDVVLHLTSMQRGKSFYGRFSLYGTADTIEGFMKQVKTAILEDDAKWLAQHLTYPCKVSIGDQRVAIQNETEFIEQFSQIAHPKFKEKVKAAFPVDLFVRNAQAMLGNGEIWIDNTKHSTETNYGFTIIAINN
jgi:hypothetical protein